MSFFDDLVNFGKGVVSAPVKFANTAATQVGEINATKDGLIAQLTGDKAGLRRATAMQNYYRKQHDNGGLFGMGSMYSSADAARGDLGTGIQKIGGGTAQTIASVAPFAKGGSIALGAGKQALLSSIPKVAGQGAAYGGLYSAGQQFADTGQINPVQLAQDTAMGAVGNVAIPLALRGGKVGLQQWAKASNAVADHGANITMPANRVAEGGFAKVPAQVPVPAPAPIPTPEPKFVQNSLTKGAKDLRQNLSDETVAAVQGQHAVRNTAQLAQRGTETVDSYKNLDDLINAANERLAVKAGTINDEDVSFLKSAIEKTEAAGNSKASADIHDALSEHLTANGQTSQAASLLYNRSPEGLYYSAVRDLKRSNEKGYQIPADVQAKLKTLKDAIKTAEPGRDKSIAVARMAKLVEDNTPRDNAAANNVLSVWKAGLLSSPITHAGNVLSNGTFGVLKKVSDLPATAADIGLSKFGKTEFGQKLGFSGERTRGLTVRGGAEGAQEGLTNAKLTMQEGIDLRNMGKDGKYDTRAELNFKNPVIQKVFGDTTNGVFRLLGSGDQPFYYAAAKNSLNDQAIAAGRNQGLKGEALEAFRKNTVANPTKEMAQIAENDAKKAVLGEDRPISAAISKFANSHPAFGVVVPFTKVPTNFLIQSLDYTPVGAIGNLVKQVKNVRGGKGVDQRSLTEAIGKATTGTALIYLGSELANSNLVSGQYPGNDAKEQQRWKAEGIQPNSIKIYNPVKGKEEWIGLNYLGPVGILLQAGKDYHDAAAKGDNAAMGSIAGVGKSLTGQSFLTGFSGFSDALKDPQRNAASFVNSQAASILPNWLRTAANASDPAARQVDNVGDAFQNGLPGFRTNLKQKQDVYGNKLNQRTDPVGLVLNPLKPSESLTADNNVLQEVNRLHTVNPNDKNLQVTPTTQDASVTVNNKAVALSKQQQYDLQNAIGQATQSSWDKLMQTPEYQALSDTDKAAALTNSRSDIKAIAERQYVEKNNLGQYNKQLTNAQKNLSSGTTGIEAYAKSDTTDSTSATPINAKLTGSSKEILTKYNSMSTDQRKQSFDSQNDAEYKYEQAKYDNDVASNKLSKAEAARAKSGLAKSKVGASYSKETRDLHSLSKQDLYNVLTNDPNGAKIAEQIIAYDDALAAAGIAKNKFRDSKGNIALSPSTAKGGRGGGRKGSTSQASLISATASGAKTAANAKLAKRGGGFQSKISGRSIEAYKKPTKTIVRKT